MKASNIAATFTASFTPSLVPFVMASSTLLPILSLLTSISWLIASVGGTSIFEKIMAAGAAITEAVSRCFANSSRSTGSSPPSMAMYAASTPPASVAIPPVITSRISDLLILSR